MRKRAWKKMILPLALILCGGTARGSFRDRGWSVRATGMAGAFSALADDGSALFVNPAGTAWMRRPEASFMWNEAYPGLKDVNMSLGFFSLVALKPWGAWGGAVTNFDASGLLRENMALLHTSRRWGNSLSFGMNLKYLTHDFLVGSDSSAADNPAFANGTTRSALTFDAGMTCRFGKKIVLGFLGRNLTEPDVGLVSRDKVPAELQAGSAWHPRPRMTVAADATYRRQTYGDSRDKSNLHLGVENWFSMRRQMVGARLGVSLKDVACGFSLYLWPQGSFSLRVDYAFSFDTRLAQDYAGIHRIGLAMPFGGSFSR